MKSELDPQEIPGGESVPFVKIIDADHHVMYDQPIALNACLVSLLGEWDRAYNEHGQDMKWKSRM